MVRDPTTKHAGTYTPELRWGRHWWVSTLLHDVRFTWALTPAPCHSSCKSRLKGVLHAVICAATSWRTLPTQEGLTPQNFAGAAPGGFGLFCTLPISHER